MLLFVLAGVGWVIYDVGAIIMTSGVIPNWQWWSLVGGGAFLVIITIVGAIIDYVERGKLDSRIDDLRLELATAKGKLETRFDVVTQLGVESVRRLQEITHTIGQPVPTSIEVAMQSIEDLRSQVTELKTRARYVTRDQRRRFGQALPRIIPELFHQPPDFAAYHGVRINHGSTVEAKNYAEELYVLFGEHGITSSMSNEVTFESLNTAGLQMLVVDPSNPTDNDKTTMALLDAADIKYNIRQADTGLPRITVLLVGRASR